MMKDIREMEKVKNNWRMWNFHSFHLQSPPRASLDATYCEGRDLMTFATYFIVFKSLLTKIAALKMMFMSKELYDSSYSSSRECKEERCVILNHVLMGQISNISDTSEPLCVVLQKVNMIRNSWWENYSIWSMRHKDKLI